jgi:hypothetical protein
MLLIGSTLIDTICRVEVQKNVGLKLIRTVQFAENH